MKDAKDYLRISELMLSLCEGDLTREQMAELEEMLRGDDEAIEYCVDLLMDNSFFLQTGRIDVPNQSSADSTVVSKGVSEFVSKASELIQDGSFDNEIWKMLADAERQAEGLPRKNKRSQKETLELIQKVERQKVEYRFKRSSLITFAVSIAAVLLVIVFIKYAPTNPGIGVATLIDTMNAKWADSTDSIQKGMPLKAGQTPLLLREGIVKLLFNDNAQVVIEGPAEFCLVNEDQIQLSYGMLYAEIPNEAIGFTVNTPTVRVIDLGTEFGVKAEFDGDVELHVIKGKTTLISSQSGRMVAQVVNANDARMFSVQTQQTVSIACEHEQFARDFASNDQFIWRGKETISLADIVGGGNGFGTGTLNAGIDYTGKIKVLDTYSSDVGPSEYVPVTASPFIDGIFIPNGPTQINSDRAFYDDFEPTNNYYWLGVLNGAWHQIDLTVQVQRHQLRLNGIEYGVPEHPAIYMSANQGITFDLQAIRRYTGMDIARFTSKCGLSESYPDYWAHMKAYPYFVEVPKATFEVLIDGQVRFALKDTSYSDSVGTIDIQIRPNDRYLTLTTTQGSDGTNNGDWTLYADPVLHIEQQP